MTENPTQTTPPPGVPPQGSFLDDTFARLRASGYERDTDARWFGGVCAGLARRFAVDPVLVRAAAVVLAFVGGLGLTIYVLLWLVMPDRRGDILAERAIRRGDIGPIVLLVVAVLLLVGGVFSIGQGDGWIAPLWLIPIAVVAWFVVGRDRRRGIPQYPAPYGTPPPPPPGAPAMSAPTSTPPPAGGAPVAPGSTPAAPTAPYAVPPQHAYAPSQPYGSQPYGTPAGPYGGQPGPYGGPAPYGGRPTPPAPPRPIAPPPPPKPRRRRPSAFVGLLSVGIVLVGLGLGAALDDPIGFPGSWATLGFLLALTGVSLVVLALGISGRGSGFSGLLVVVLGLLLLASSAASRVDVQDGVGDRTWMPVPASGTSSFELGAGDATLDLSRLETGTDVSPTTPQVINVEMGVGGLTILVPSGLDARIDASVGMGNIRHTGGTVTGVNESSGTDRTTSTTYGDEPVDVVVDAQLGLGEITIQEQ